MPQHRSFLVLPDPKLAGASAVQSATSEGGRVPGRGTPDSNNEGNLSAFISGRAISDSASFDLRIQTSGGIVEGAAWAWRRVGEDDSGWRGSNDRRFLHSLEDPFHPGGNSDPVPVARVEILYSERLQREFVYRDGAGKDLEVLYRDVGETETAWTKGTATFEGGVDFNGSESMFFAGCVLPDGAFRMMVFRDNDLDVYHSDDGISWTRIADNIHSRFAGRLATSLNGLWLAESGGYLLALYIENDVDGIVGVGPYITTMVSSDRGSTWTEIDSGAFPAGLMLARFGPSGVDRYAVSVCGVGDASGTFILTNRSTFAPQSFITSTRSGFGGWGNVRTVSFGAYRNFDRVILGRTSTQIVALFVDWEGATRSSPGDYAVATLDRRVALSGQQWQVSSQITGFDASALYRIGAGRAVWIGSTLAVLGKKYDPRNGARYDGALYFRLGEAWSKSPLFDRVWEGYAPSAPGRPVAYQPTDGPLFSGCEWHAVYGWPDLAAGSDWVRVSGGAFVANRGDRFEFYATAGKSATFVYNDPTSYGTAPSESWMTSTSISRIGGSLVAWECAILRGSSVASEVVGVKVESRDPASPLAQTRITVRIDQTSAVVYDENTSSSIATLTPSAAVYGSTPFADRWEFRLAFCPRPTSSPRLLLLMARKYGTPDWIATTLRVFTGRTAAISARYEQTIEFGILSGPPSGSTQCLFFSARVHSGDDLRQAVQVATNPASLADDSRPHVVRGRECSPFPVAVVDGVEVSWGGGGGFDGDLYQSIVDYQYAALNTLLGPRFEWRSDDSPASTESIVYVAGPEDHARFRHDALAVFGLNVETATVEYDDDPSFPSPTAAGTINLRRFDSLRVESVDGETVSIAGASTPEDGEVSSNDARSYFVRVLAVPAGATSISVGDCFEIDEQREDVLDLGSGEFLPATVGATLAIYADRGAVVYSSAVVGRYLRVSLDSTSPPGGVFRLGAVVAGTTMPIDVPLEWQHSDSDEPTATTYRSRSGISWAYIEGPPRRTVTGTVVGDAGTFRARLRNLLRSTSRYVEKPVVLCLDDRDLTNAETTILARIPDAVAFEQTGWRYLEAEDRWIPVGDASMTFEQDV